MTRGITIDELHQQNKALEEENTSINTSRMIYPDIALIYCSQIRSERD